MAADTLTRRQLNRATLARQMLLARESVPVVEAVERLAGLQAQEAKHPFAGLWTRVEGFAREDLHSALHERDVVRASMMRATLHLASARDYSALRPSLRPVMSAAMVALRGRDQGLKGVKAVLGELREELVVFSDERGRELFDLPGAPRPDAGVAAPPRFLPEFDNLVLAHDDRTRVLPDEHRSVIVTKNLRVRATFLWDGFVRGTWTTERKKDRATLRLAPLEALTKRAVRELAAEGEALLRFLEPDATSLDVALEPS